MITPEIFSSQDFEKITQNTKKGMVIFMSQIFGNSINMLSKSLDYLWLKQSVTLNNIANSETVGYKAEYVDFEAQFKAEIEKALATGKSSSVQSAMAGVDPTVVKTTNDGLRLDENNVNVDVEMVELSKTNLQYQYAITSLNSDITRMSTVIKGQ